MKKALNVLTSLLFVGIVLCLGIANIASYNGKDISSSEKRVLAKFPAMNLRAFFEDGYASQFERALKDQFFLRDDMIQFVRVLRSFDGVGMKVAQYSGNIGVTDIMDSRMAQYYKTDMGWIYAYISSPKNEKTYVDSISAFAQKHPEYQVMNMLIPNKAAFFYDASVNYSDDQNKTTADIEGKLKANSVDVISIYEDMMKDDPQKMYFMTDHHWNGYGTLISYQNFCDFYSKKHPEFEYSSDLIKNYLDKNYLKKYNLTFNYYEGFVGSLLAQTGDSDMLEHPDTMLVYKPLTPHMMYSWWRINSIEDSDNLPVPMYENVSPALVAERPSYGMYLGGDKGLVIVKRRILETASEGSAENNSKTGSSSQNNNGNQNTGDSNMSKDSKILIVKDSYGNALSALLINIYDETHIIDPRYFNASIEEYMVKNNIDTVFFLNATNVTKNKSYVESIRRVVSEEGN